MTRNLAVTNRNLKMGIQNMVCPSFTYSDAWLVVACTSQNMWHLSLTSPAQRQINHHGNPPSVNHPNLDQYLSNLHVPATVLCVSLLRIDGSLFYREFTFVPWFFWTLSVQFNRFASPASISGNPSFLHQYISNHHAPATIVCTMLPRIDGCVDLCEFLCLCFCFLQSRKMKWHANIISHTTQVIHPFHHQLLSIPHAPATISCLLL